MEEDTLDVIFDPSGDLELIVGECDRQRKFRVSSKAMCLVSLVWRAMLDPSGYFMEAQPVKGRVTFPEDDGDTMHLLLCVVHYKFNLIPLGLKYEKLFNLAILCDKYDTVDILYPWLPKWLEDLTAIAIDSGKEGSLFISWVFKDATTFERVAQKLVKEISIDKSGERITRNGRGLEVLEQYIPQGVMSE